MNDQQQEKLRKAAVEIAARVGRFRDRSLGEQNTKASLIEPILEALGWDIRDPDEVHHEFKPTTRDNPVDYALAILRNVRLFVEAKGLGESLGDRKWVAQILGYATVAGVEWCVLTDGDEYRFYNATAPVDADEKLFCTVRLSQDTPERIGSILSLMSRSNMEENLLDVLWSSHFVDRRVKGVLHDLVQAADKGLSRLIRKHSRKLTPKEVADSLRRLIVRIELPALPGEDVPSSTRPSRSASPKTIEKLREAGRKAAESRRRFGSISLLDLISAGFLSPPVRLFRRYKGKVLEAELQSDGQVKFQGKCYVSCSTAAEVARQTVVGRRMNTNGWDFWQIEDEKSKKTSLNKLRKAYLSADRKAGAKK